MMKRTRRQKYLKISVFFVIYSIIHVVSTGNKDEETTTVKVDKDTTTAHNSAAHEHLLGIAHGLTSHGVGKGVGKTTVSPTVNSAAHEHILGMIHTHAAHSSSKGNTSHDKTEDKTESPAKSPHQHIVETMIEHSVQAIGNQSNETTEEDCTPPAIKQFPHPIMGPTTRKHGGLIIHIIVAVYMFVGLAIVCDEYFVASLDCICEELKMSPDVAGATFMAAGSSAPELATVIIGVFLAKDDIGISGVIGSAVFNIMFVIACCGLCSTAVVYLNWWPLVRDCFFYAVSILVMLVVIFDKKISWIESLIMILTYVIYGVVLHYNTPLERWAQTWPVPFKVVAPTEQSRLVSYKTLDDSSKHQSYGMEQTQNQDYGSELNQPSQQSDYYADREGGIFVQAAWALVFPIHWFCRKTMPDCRSEKYRNWYPFTFFVSMVWISFYSYFMVWMITIIGYTLGIPDTVMGLTFVAAGVSVPDALPSVAVIKEGYGDMAVSNAVGSNVFDILICLGLPWFIKTAIIKPGSTVNVISKGLTYSTLSLLSTVVFLVVATHMNGWKLDRKFGMMLMVWYLIFITFASLYELNVFGYMNPPECPTDW